MEKIPTPMKLQMRRFRYQVLPVIVFTVALIATIFLWRNRGDAPNGVGEVTAVSVKVSAPLDGKLLDVDREVRLYDHVTAGQEIARFELDPAEDARHADLLDDMTKKQKALDQATKDEDAARKAGDKARETAARGQATTLRRAVNEARAEFHRVDKRIKDRVIVAPASGTVTAIFHRSGEFVRAGQDVMTITQDDGGYIVAFVRQGTAVVPAQNDRVTVRGQDTTKSATTIVQQVSRQVQPIPEHQLTNPKKPEWGFPVRIAMPNTSELKLRPGELVVLNFEKKQQ